MSKLLDKVVTLSSVPKHQKRQPLPLPSRIILQELSYYGLSMPVYAGVNFMIPRAAPAQPYNMQQARHVLQIQQPPIELHPVTLFSNQTLQQIVQTEGEIIWIEGAPKLSRTQWAELSVFPQGLTPKGAVGMLLHPHSEQAQLLPTLYPWIPVLTI